jgi:DNA (cytosine-5)-methyltransferase 1
MFRIIGEVQPKFVFAENVSRKAIEKAAKDCQSLGYQTETIGLSAKNLGADHIRRRHWLLAYSNMRDELFSTLNAEASRLPKFYLSIWKTYPNESGMVNGMADRMDRFRAIGNGQVPIVVATAFSILIQRFVNQVDKSINIFDNFFIENSISD